MFEVVGRHLKRLRAIDNRRLNISSVSKLRPPKFPVQIGIEAEYAM